MPVVTERYEAVVTSIEDEENRGRIEVACVGIGADPTTPIAVLCEPAHDWGWFVIPDVGETVEVEVVVSSDRDQVWGEAALEELSPVWRSKRFLTDIELEDDADGSVSRPIHDDFLSTNYGKRRGFCTPWGHVLLFDDTEGDPRIYVTHMGEQLEPGEAPEPENYTRVELEPDGSLKIGFLNRHQLHLTTEQGNLLIAFDGEPGSEKHTLEFDAETPKFEISMAEGKHVLTFDGSGPHLETTHDSGAGIKVDQKDGDTVTTLGDGAVSATIAEHLEAWLNDVYTPAIADMHDNHIHPLPQFIAPLIPLSPIPTIPGGPPAPPSEAPVMPAMLEDYDTNITSGKLVFPDN